MSQQQNEFGFYIPCDKKEASSEFFSNGKTYYLYWNSDPLLGLNLKESFTSIDQDLMLISMLNSRTEIP